MAETGRHRKRFQAIGGTAEGKEGKREVLKVANGCKGEKPECWMGIK